MNENEILTYTLNSGVVVSAKMYDNEPSPITYANRTQAEKAVARLGTGWEVYKSYSRPFYAANKAKTMEVRFAKTAQSFQAAIGRIATAVNWSKWDVYALWLEYAETCRNCDQSPVLFEFIQWHAKEMGVTSNHAGLRAAIQA